MPRYARLRVLMLLMFIVSTVSLVPAKPAAAQDLPWRDKSSPFGIVAALGNRVRSDEIPTAVNLLKEAGVQWQREEIFWHEVQFQPGGPFRWGGDDEGRYNYDLAIGAQVDAGINVLGLLDYNPAWFKGRNPRPDEWLNDWGTFVYNSVARYGRDRGQIHYWELWNEPNLEQFGYQAGLYTVQDYVNILMVGSAAAHAADPNAKIVMGGIAAGWGASTPNTYSYFDYLQRLADLGAWQYVDVIAIHPYRAAAPEQAIRLQDADRTLEAELQYLDDMMLKYGAKPIWITELGWSTNSVWPGVPEDAQGFLLVRTYLLSLTHPSVEKIFWYDFREDTDPRATYERPVYDRREVEFHYGLLRRHYPLDFNRGDLRKQGFAAYRTMTQMLSGMWLTSIERNGNYPEHPGVYWQRYTGGPRRVDVLWKTEDLDPVLTLNCGCHEATVRRWNGEVLQILYTDDANLSLKIDGVGSPMYVEYDMDKHGQGGLEFPNGQHLNGAFLAYWRDNGAENRFGMPITPELIETDFTTNKARITQYFERAHLTFFVERIPFGDAVRVRRLGDESLRKGGVDWRTLPSVDGAPPECVYMPETRHSICPGGILETWNRYGGLAGLGYPLTQPYPLQVAGSNTTVIAQYFERGRLEVQPDGSVSLGLLGRELFTSWGGMK